MLGKTLAIFCACLFLVEAQRSPSKKADAEVKKIGLEGTSAWMVPPCGMHFGGYNYKTYETDPQAEGTTYYIKVDVTYPRDKGLHKDQELVVFKPKTGKAMVIKYAC